ncbi:MAG: helix-turn-helix domain-containing protein [Nitrospira sp.]|jgi:predicted DNA-binding transcriptional regulator AlpA|nr:MAG: helix-turn-helix domain-containing protein [Nitrospira sp.]
MRAKDIYLKSFRDGHLWTRSLPATGLLTSRDTCHMLGITRRHLYRLIGLALHPLRRGRSLYFRISEVMHLRQQRHQQKTLEEPKRGKGGDTYGNES